MSDEELQDALDGLYAYDTGSIDSGIHDEALRKRCIEEIASKPRTPHELVPRLWMSRLIRDMWLTEERLAQGYGIEDAYHFIKWLIDRMEVPI